MDVLITGGMGYIGSHTCVQMIAAGMTPIMVDNLCNAKAEVLNRIEALTGVRPAFYQGDIRDEAFLDSVFAKHDVQAVIHFAGLKAVGESVSKPIEYYDNNVNGTLVLVRRHAQSGREKSGVQLVGDRLWRPTNCTDHRNFSNWRDHQPVWSQQVQWWSNACQI